MGRSQVRADQVVVFIDYENMHRCAGDVFKTGTGHFWPWKLGEGIIERRKRRPGAADRVLEQVRVYPGLPDARRQPTANAANQRRAAAWLANCPSPEGLYLYSRPLKYPPGWPNTVGKPQEKGVDVALAVDLVRMAHQGTFDVHIVCSHDSDLVPALDAADEARIKPGALEVACWEGRQRISLSRKRDLPWCHYLAQADLDRVADPTDYR